MKNKIKPQTQKQIDWVFSHPVSFSSLATISYPYEPEGFQVLEISPNRGGKTNLKEITISEFEDKDKRVLGVRTLEKDLGLEKEDIYEYDREKLIRVSFPRGKYQKENPLYKDTHYKKTK